MQKTRVRVMKKMGFLMSIWLLAGLFFAGTEISSAVYGDEIKVGVWKKNGEPVYEYLKTVDGVKAEYLPRKKWIEKIYDYDVLFLSSRWMSLDEPLDSELRASVIEYVHRGYGLVLAHDSYYGSWYNHVLFPEFQSPEPGVGQRYGKAMKVVKPNHPVAKGLPSEFYQCYMEHACFKPSSAKNAEVICTDGEKRPLVVTAQLGKGRVVAAGIFFLLDYIEAPEGGVKDTQKLLLNSIRWAGGVKEREAKELLLVRSSIKENLKKRRAVNDGKLAVNEVWYRLDNELDYLYGRTEDLAIAGSKKAKDVCKEIKSLREIAKCNYKDLLAREIRKLKSANYRNHAIPVKEYEWRINILPEYTIDLLRQKVTDAYISDGDLLKKEKKAYIPSAQEIKSAMKNLRSNNSEERAKGALEAGRIEIKRAVSTLIKLLKDKNYKVRRNAIYALSWIRDKRAVSPLMKIAEKDKNIKIRRRAVQALGMIGDKKASPLLLTLLNEKDRYIRQNVILSLGHLREKQAAAELIRILQQPLTNPLDGRNLDGRNKAYILQTASACSLGRIGGEEAITALRDKLEKTFKLWAGRKNELLFALYLAIGKSGDEQSIELLKDTHNYIQSHKRKFSRLVPYFPAIAISMIKEGHQNKELGIIQPSFLKKRENFYITENRFHRAVMRTTCWLNRPASEQLKHYQARTACINGFVARAGRTDISIFPPVTYIKHPQSISQELKNTLDSANRCGVKLFPGGGDGNCGAHTLSWVLDLMGDSEGFGGFWSEEHPLVAFMGIRFGEERRVEALKRYLSKKYTPRQRKELGLRDEDLKEEILKNLRKEDYIEKYRPLFVEGVESAEETALEQWQEVAEWLRQQRKNTPIFYDISSAYPDNGGFGLSICGKLGYHVASSGTQPAYCSASYDNAYSADLYGDGGENISGMEVYSCRCGTVRNYELGMGIGILHTQRFMMFTWGRVFKQPGLVAEWRGNWKEGMWEMVQRVFGNIKKVEPYLVHTETPHGIGLVFSGRTNTSPYGYGGKKEGGNRIWTRRYGQNMRDMYEALKQAHLQFDLIWMETTDKERLKNYKVLVLPNARSLTEEEISMLRKWVKEGGTLISTGSTSLCDRWGRKTGNYRLAKLLGADYVETKMANPENYRYYLPRDLKEQKYITSFTTSSGLNLEYDRRAGYDIVQPSTGKVTGKWADSSPAVVVNNYGKGESIFLTGISMGAACKYNHMQTSYPLHRTFYPGVVKLIKSFAENAYTQEGEKLPLVVENCPLHTEVLMKTQNNGKRKIIHLLNYDNENKNLINDIKISVLWSGKDPEKVFLPVTDEELTYQRNGDYISFMPGDLDIWNMIVIE